MNRFLKLVAFALFFTGYFSILFYLKVVRGYKTEFILMCLLFLASVYYIMRMIMDKLYIKSRLFFVLLAATFFIANSTLFRLMLRKHKMSYHEDLPDFALFVGAVLLYHVGSSGVHYEKRRKIEKKFVFIPLYLLLLWALETTHIFGGPIVFLHFLLVSTLVPTLIELKKKKVQ